MSTYFNHSKSHLLTYKYIELVAYVSQLHVIAVYSYIFAFACLCFHILLCCLFWLCLSSVFVALGLQRKKEN